MGVIHIHLMTTSPKCTGNLDSNFNHHLGGGFKYVLCSPLFGEDSHFDEHIFQMGWSHQAGLFSTFFSANFIVFFLPGLFLLVLFCSHCLVLICYIVPIWTTLTIALEDERLEPENTGPLEKEQHLNQAIIFRFYVNLRGCSIDCMVQSVFWVPKC